MSSLNSRSQRLLSLRAGLNGPPRSARAVARILRISAGREEQLERRSLLALQTVGRRGCGASATQASASGSASGSAPGSSSVPGGGATSASGSSPGASTGSAASGASSKSHVKAAGGRSATPVALTRAAVRTAEQAWSTQGPVPGKEIALLLVLAIGASLAWARRRRPPVVAGGLPPAREYAQTAPPPEPVGHTGGPGVSTDPRGQS